MSNQTVYEEFKKEIKECGKLINRTFIRTQCKNCNSIIEYDRRLKKRHKGYCVKCVNIAKSEESPSKALKLVGKKFGCLTVISKRESSKCGKTRWFCRCSCGNSNISTSGLLGRRKNQTCGCVHGLTPKEYIKSNI